jgi:parallel beta-helix repeat protein
LIYHFEGSSSAAEPAILGSVKAGAAAVALAAALAVATPAHAATYTVTSTADAGPGTLRAGLATADAHVGKDTIAFDIGGGGPQTIALAGQLVVNGPVVIEGLTQPGPGSDPRITIDGGGGGFTCVAVFGRGATVRGLAVRRCVAAVLLSGDGEHTVDRSRLSESTEGVEIAGSELNVVMRSQMLGNSLDGVAVVGGGATQNTVGPGNLVGLRTTGELDPNPQFGVRIIGAGTQNTVRGNTIAGSLFGVLVSCSTPGQHLVTDNRIGTGVAGRAAKPNEIGVDIDCPGNSVTNNVVSGNTHEGIFVPGNNNTVSGNRVGVKAPGGAALPNGTSGIAIQGNRNLISNNVASGNVGSGIHLDGSATGNRIQDNFVGTDATGKMPLGNGGAGISSVADGPNVIGGTGGLGNVVSANGFSGLDLRGDGTIVQGNIIGLATGPGSPLPNGFAGIYVVGDGIVIGGSAGSALNLISHNTHDGIRIDGGDGTRVENNIVTSNGDAGIAVASGVGNDFLANPIYGNGALAIDLGADGVTPNDPLDPDLGPNRLQNKPVLVSTGPGPTPDTTVVKGTLDSVAGVKFRIDIYVSPSCGSAGYSWVGTAYATTDGAGHAMFNRTFTTVSGTPFVTMTATSMATRDTSELSAC